MHCGVVCHFKAASATIPWIATVEVKCNCRRGMSMKRRTCSPWFQISCLTKLSNQSYCTGWWVDAIKRYKPRTAIDICMFGKEFLVEANNRSVSTKLLQDQLCSFIQISIQISHCCFDCKESSLLLKIDLLIYPCPNGWVHVVFCWGSSRMQNQQGDDHWWYNRA